MNDNKASAVSYKDSIKNESSEKMSWSDLSVHTYIKIGILGLLWYWLFKANIDYIVAQWFNDPSWSHGILIPFFSLYFINQAKTNLLNIRPKPSIIGFLLLLAALIFYPLNLVHFQYGYLESLTAVATLGAIVLFIGGWKTIKYTWLPIAFLIFAIPLPQRYYVALTMPLRKLAATVASTLLNFISGLDAVANGVVIDVFYHGQKVEPALNVADACSGMRLLMAFLALGVAMAYLHYRPIWQRLVLLASTIPIAIFCNVVRVTVTGIIYVLIAPKYASGIYHDMLGFLMLGLAFGIYSGIAWFMSNLFVEEDEPEPVKKDIIISNRYDHKDQ